MNSGFWVSAGVMLSGAVLALPLPRRARLLQVERAVTGADPYPAAIDD